LWASLGKAAIFINIQQVKRERMTKAEMIEKIAKDADISKANGYRSCS
jgi:hypothetical protein